MKATAQIKFNESSLEETADVLMKINPLDWGSRDALIRYMKSETYSIMWEKEEKHFTHWGTAGFYITVFPEHFNAESTEPEFYYASATLMPYTVAVALKVKA